MVESLPATGHIVRFGVFELDRHTGELRKSGLRVSLQEQPLQVLTMLLERSGGLVTREELRQRLWPADTFVDFEQGLNAAVKRLRATLGDSAEVPQFIETLPRRGYRLICAAEPVSPVANADPMPVPSPPARRRSLASKWLLLTAAILSVGGAALIWQRVSTRRSQPASGFRTALLTKLSGEGLDHALSPDARAVAFCQESEGTRGLYVKDIGSGQQVRVADGLAGVYSPAWSPDGREIAFLRRPKSGERLVEIVVVPAAGGAERRLGTVLGSNPGLDWSPDGRLLAFVDKVAEKGPDAIHLLDVATGERRRLTTPVGTAPNLGDHEPSFSPDGRSVAFIRRGGVAPTSTDLYLHDVGASGSRPITSGYGVRDVAWSPFGRAVVFVGGRPQQGTLWMVDAGGGEVRRLHGGAENVGTVSLARGSRVLSFEERILDSNIWVGSGPASVHHERPRALPASPRQETQPDYSPDGRRIAFATTRGAGLGIRVCAEDGSDCVDFESEEFLSRPRWSPDGQSLVTVGWQGDQPLDIFRVDVASRFVRRLTTDNAVDTMPSWSRDGRWLYFASDRSGSYEVWKMPSEGGAARQLTRRGGVTASETEDGRWIYYTNAADLGTLWKMPAEGGNETLVFDHRIHLGKWTLWRDRVVYVDVPAAGAQQVMVFDPVTRRNTTLFSLDRSSGSGIAVSPDGAWLLYAQRDQVTSDILRVEGLAQ